MWVETEEKQGKILIMNMPISKVARDEISYKLLKAAQQKFGAARMEMGVMLEDIRRNEAWKGRAASFTAFLEEERINERAAYQYMRVAKKLFYELGLTDAEFADIATCNMNVLDLACQVITAENKEDVLSMLAALSERDARQCMFELSDEAAASNGKADANRAEQQLSKVHNLYRSLPDDQRIEFLRKVGKR